jgi:transketolase
MEGISEANMIGMAAGLAMEGKIPYVNTIATFLTRRCFEQVVVDLGLHNLNVRLLGNGGGLVYAPLGPTHEAIEDIAIMRAIPNMTVIAPADANEMRRAMLQSLDHKGPMYIRIAKGGDPIVTSDDIPFEIGRAFLMRPGSDALVITTGVTLGAVLEASERFKEQGLQVAVMHVPTIKPLDMEAITAAIARVPIVVTIEEHTLNGGLGSAIAEIIAEANFPSKKYFKRIGIPDVFADRYGSQASLMKQFGITAENLMAVIKQFVDWESKTQKFMEEGFIK